MIYTVTLNPAVDQTIIIDNFKINEVNRVVDAREDVGGKGINVSKMIKNLKGKSVALGIIGGNKGEFIEEQLKSMGIDTDFVKKDTNTRTNIKIVDKVNDTFTDINEKGGEVDYTIIKNIEEKILKTVKTGDILVLAGSVPSNVGSDIYNKWIKMCNEKKVKVFLDADGDLLKQGVKAGPYLIKPNIDELERLFNKKIENINQCISLTKELLFKYGIEIIVVSMGGDGALVITKNNCIKVKALKVEVKSTVGAGDSMVGALAYALDNGYPLEEAIKLSVAASTATISHEGTIMGNLDEIEDLKNKVELEMIGE
ncbi:1-phosphofructokinase [Defluviitalea phaphyphila]|uniref:1-phosphofructokinase n=1 Tax=Defluviitalea phaphyphila TaxID=1473580 RepID=UPI00072FB5A7|nr:1-phosphofructokinase [Defluviitalea phaphyphila]